jgi:membrane protein implicated in regulation of membrane protease activity
MRQRRLRWDAPAQRSIPKHPYRDTALVYGGMAVVVVLIAWATGGGLTRALAISGLFFVVATLWSWRSWRNRLRTEEARARETPP